MARIINDGGCLTFTASSGKVFLVIAVLGAFICWMSYMIYQAGFPIDPSLSGRETRNIQFMYVLDGLLICLFLLFFGCLLNENSFFLRIEKDRIVYKMLFLQYEWTWDDIDQLHLGYSVKRPPANHLLGMGIGNHALYFVRPIHALSRRFFNPAPSHLKFEDIAFDSGKTHRKGMRPEADGFVAIPLALFNDPADIFTAADQACRNWHFQNNRQKA